MKIWIRGTSASMEKGLKKGNDIIGVQKTMASYVLRWALALGSGD